MKSVYFWCKKNRITLILVTVVLTLSVAGIVQYFRSNNSVDAKPYDDLIGSMIEVEGGTFQMGTPDTASDRVEDEISHTVSVGSFQMQATEVTQGLYQAVMGENPSEDKSWKDYPVTNVSWEDAVSFCEKLSQLTGRTYRLPTEAEWEYAAQGGNRSRHYKYSGSDDINAVAWYGENSGERLHRGREKQPNELGLYDMSGNVWEWCSDWYGPYRTDAVGSDNPKGPDNGQSRVNRGGGWNYIPQGCRVAYRYNFSPDLRHHNLGFRMVLVPVR